MNKTDFIHEVDTFLQGSCSKKVIKEVLEAAGFVTVVQVKHGNTVDVMGLGKLKAVVRAERTGRNPRTGDAIAIPAKKAAKFSASKALKDAIN